MPFRTAAILIVLCALIGAVAAAQPVTAPHDSNAPAGPSNYPGDSTVWPNRISHANGDSWLMANHDRIRRMYQRLLLINFSNRHTTNHVLALANQLIAILAESSRYHGYRDTNAPAFLNYQIAKFIDLRDSDRTTGNSRLIPVKDPKAKAGFNMKYAAFFTDEFAGRYGFRDPHNTNRFLRLDELVDGGYIHELWFFESGDTKADVHVGAFEVVEWKPVYDERFHRVGDRHVQAGNGGDPDEPWTGRSVRIGFVNASRGPGCFLESLSHGMEGIANSKAIPYFTRYFNEYAGFDLRERYHVPFSRLYGVKDIAYPDAHTLTAKYGGSTYAITNYVATGGNVHFPPNGRSDYDMANTNAVNSTIEDWRMGSGADGQDEAIAWTPETFRQYRKFAPDCMGPWLVYWRQNMPGLDNRQKDDKGRAMKNWWPFLFY